MNRTNLEPTMINPRARLGTRPVRPNLEPIENRTQSACAIGDVGQIDALIQIAGDMLCDAVDLGAGETVLDVAAGNGNASRAAARRFASVISTDVVPERLAPGTGRVEVEGPQIVTRIADAEDLPFRDGQFDVAVSSFGAMFAPHPERAATELVRVVRSSGRIGLANWRSHGFVGELLRVLGQFVAPPRDVKPPTAWGTESRIIELFGAHATDIRTERKQLLFHDLSAAHWSDVFRRSYGPAFKGFEALSPAEQEGLRAALLGLLTRYNRGGRGTLILPGDYLEVVVWRA